MFERTDALRDGGWREVETASRSAIDPWSITATKLSRKSVSIQHKKYRLKK